MKKIFGSATCDKEFLPGLSFVDVLLRVVLCIVRFRELFITRKFLSAIVATPRVKNLDRRVIFEQVVLQ